MLFSFTTHFLTDVGCGASLVAWDNFMMTYARIAATPRTHPAWLEGLNNDVLGTGVHAKDVIQAIYVQMMKKVDTWLRATPPPPLVRFFLARCLATFYAHIRSVP